MKTVPSTSFDANWEEYKLAMNCIEAATAAIIKRDLSRALLLMDEAKTIISKWPQSSLAGHMHKRIAILVETLEALKK